MRASAAPFAISVGNGHAWHLGVRLCHQGSSVAIFVLDIETIVRISRLLQIKDRLITLFGSCALAKEIASLVLVAAPEPHLLIGGSAKVIVDEKTGLYTFQEGSIDADLIVVSGDEHRLIDHVIFHFSIGLGRVRPESVDAAIGMMVGETIACVERRLILETLRHLNGNKTRSADMLGVSLRTIRNKLKNYSNELKKVSLQKEE